MTEVKKQELKADIKSIVYHPVVLGGLSVVLFMGALYISGIIMQVLTGTVLAYKGLKSAVNKPV